MLSQDVSHIVHDKLSALDVPRALSVEILLRYDAVAEIGNLPLDPLHYRNSEDYFCAAQATALLKKSKFLNTGDDLETRALTQWWECERSCFRTNIFLYKYLNGQTVEPWVAHFISKARSKMRKILGPAPDPFQLDWRFGPGATMSDPSSQSTVPDKMTSQVTLTGDAIPFLNSFSRTAWGRGESSRKREMSEVRGNKYFTVPKDAFKRRTCAKEPSLNVSAQLALGRVMRSRLLQNGIDLKNGKKIHQNLARLASLDGISATLDLSNASDCIAEGLVRALCPTDWYDLLDRARSKFTKVDRNWVKLEKFSSMGNGFTFELETLVFLCLICAIDPVLEPGVNVYVYGDDVIIPTEYARAVLGCFQMFGLTPNWNKSFLSGPFRESCGGDYFLGRDVRPYYWKEDINEPARLISLANGFRRARQKCQDPERQARLLRVWFSVLDRIPSHVRRCRGPEALGDLVIHDEIAYWDARVKDSIRMIRVWRPAEYRKVLLDRFDPDVVWGALLYGVILSGNAKNDSERYLIPRKGVLGYRCGWVPFS